MAQVEIVIPNWNGIQYLKDCLESLAAQKDAPEYQVILVDNGSQDESVEWTRQHFPQVSIIELPENTGFCHAVNVGIEQGSAEYVILLNNDTKAEPDFVKNLYNAIAGRENEKVFSVSAAMLCWQDESLLDGAGDRYTILGWAYARGKGKKTGKYDKPVRIFSACGGAAIYRRSVLEKIGLFDERHFAYLEDLDLGYRANIAGYRNYYEPAARVVHFGSATSGARYNAWKTQLAAENSVYVNYKNMPFLQWFLNSPFLLAGKLVKWLFFCKKGLGKAYAKGLVRGVKKSLSKEGRSRKTSYSWRASGNYLWIQGQLFLNVCRLLMKS